MMSPSVYSWRIRSFMSGLIILRFHPCPLSSPKTAALINRSDNSEISRRVFTSSAHVRLDREATGFGGGKVPKL